MAIFAEVTENECITDRHVRDIDNTSRFTMKTWFNIVKCLLHRMVYSDVRCALSLR